MKPDERAPKPSGFFVLRTPLLAFDVFERWAAGLKAPFASEPAALEAALAEDRARLRRGLADALERPEAREALFVASPSLFGSLDPWHRDPAGEQGQKVERALVRYFARMCSRPTPFGLFAGCTVGELGSETSLALGPLDEARRHTRLDNDYLLTLAEALARDPKVRAAVPHVPNTSLFALAGKWRYAEGRRVDETRDYHLVTFDRSPALDATLARAAKGARPDALVRDLVASEGVTEDEARAFVEALIASRLLTPSLEPPVTGVEPIYDLLGQLRDVPSAAPTVEVLGQVRRELEALDQRPLGEDVRTYQRLADALGALPAPVELSRLFQLDLMKPAPLRLGPAVMTQVQRGLGILQRI
ncbi:MAG: lantibiotic dehydratase, partial [Myxococcaceae bacterium]|nr:lantibiotic dehydratase [Myxococcaceae bacterium]